VPTSAKYRKKKQQSQWSVSASHEEPSAFAEKAGRKRENSRTVDVRIERHHHGEKMQSVYHLNKSIHSYWQSLFCHAERFWLEQGLTVA
jgi:hypothetical protein